MIQFIDVTRPLAISPCVNLSEYSNTDHGQIERINIALATVMEEELFC